MFVPATAIAQASCSTQQEVQTFSSQPSTSDQTPSQWQNDYGTYINLINETSDEDNEDDLYSAIIASIEDTTRPKEHIPISQILSELSDKIDNLQVCKFNINRSAVLDGAIRGFRRLSYDPNKKMSIKFSDDRGTTEEAVDLGGPRREFLHLLMEALAESDMFEGPEGHLNLALISSAVREDRYFIAGRAVAVSLVHGGPPPCFLSRTLFACIAEGPDACRPVLEDITDMELYSKLKQVSEAKTLEELQQFTEPLTDYLANAGCLRHLTSLVDKDQLLEDVLMFQVVQRVRGPLERFSDGLKTLGVLQKIKHHPEAFRPVLCYSPGTLTAEIMDDLFDIRWSEMGSNNRANENRVVAYWRDYLQDAEEEEGPAKLGDILSFATGCHVVPPIGFSPKPSLEFQRGRYPIANTCVNCLRIPLHQSYEDFKSNMDFAIQNTQQILNILIDISCPRSARRERYFSIAGAPGLPTARTGQHDPGRHLRTSNRGFTFSGVQSGSPRPEEEPKVFPRPGSSKTPEKRLSHPGARFNSCIRSHRRPLRPPGTLNCPPGPSTARRDPQSAHRDPQPPPPPPPGIQDSLLSTMQSLVGSLSAIDARLKALENSGHPPASAPSPVPAQPQFPQMFPPLQPAAFPAQLAAPPAQAVQPAPQSTLASAVPTPALDLSIGEFVVAFGIHRDVICSVYPDRRLQLDGYLALIGDLNLKYGRNRLQGSASPLSVHPSDPPSKAISQKGGPGWFKEILKIHPSTPVDVPALASELSCLPDQVFVDHLITGLSQGFRAPRGHKRASRSPAPPQPGQQMQADRHRDAKQQPIRKRSIRMDRHSSLQVRAFCE
uniref:uncharacterized protein n=1 Tax=Centroberyx gerrardi TaxID=166262 RepID=UPI003AAB1521